MSNMIIIELVVCIVLAVCCSILVFYSMPEKIKLVSSGYDYTQEKKLIEKIHELQEQLYKSRYSGSVYEIDFSPYPISKQIKRFGIRITPIKVGIDYFEYRATRTAEEMVINKMAHMIAKKIIENKQFEKVVVEGKVIFTAFMLEPNE